MTQSRALVELDLSNNWIDKFSFVLISFLDDTVYYHVDIMVPSPRPMGWSFKEMGTKQQLWKETKSGSSPVKQK